MAERDVRRELGDMTNASFGRLYKDAKALEQLSAFYYRTYGTVTEGKRLMKLADKYRKLAAELDRTCNDIGIR